MSQYLNQYNPSHSASKPSDNLQHYRIQIRKLQQKLKQTTNDYEKRIHELENELKHHRKPIFQNTSTSKPAADLNFQIYQRDNTIKELKNQNTKLRQVINNPDHILIKKQNNFELMTQKDNQINRLKKALIDIESKYDGQFFNEHKVKKQYDMLAKENESLKLHIRNIETQRRSYNQENAPNEVLETINYKKQFQAANKENQVLRKMIMEQQQSYKSSLRVSQRPSESFNSNIKKSNILAINTQMEEMKLQVEEYKAKNRELLKRANDLTKQNQQLLAQKQRTSRLVGRESKKVESTRLSKIKQGQQQEQQLIKYYKNRQTIRASLAQESNKAESTPKKFGKYYELGIDQSYANRQSKSEIPIIQL